LFLCQRSELRETFIPLPPTEIGGRKSPSERCYRAFIGVNSLLPWSESALARGESLVAAMQRITDWLKKLGMSEYAERFAENKIDISVLPDLTEQHLKDLGIALGHR
jgi:hypothetical protein